MLERIAALWQGTVNLANAEPFLVLFTTLDIAAIVLGLLVRLGYAWILAVNVVLVMAFVYLTAFPNVVLLFYGVMYGLVFVLLMVNRPWFLTMGRWRETEERRR